jgi:hypothetical protein
VRERERERERKRQKESRVCETECCAKRGQHWSYILAIEFMNNFISSSKKHVNKEDGNLDTRRIFSALLR